MIPFIRDVVYAVGVGVVLAGAIWAPFALGRVLVRGLRRRPDDADVIRFEARIVIADLVPPHYNEEQRAAFHAGALALEEAWGEALERVRRWTDTADERAARIAEVISETQR